MIEILTREELERRIEIADRVLWETGRGPYSYHWWRDYSWLQGERARLACKLGALKQQGEEL